MKTRNEILVEANVITMTNREADYGPPVESMANIATMWEAYLKAKHGFPNVLSAEDVAHMMSLLKIARTFSGGFKADTYIDAAAYAAIAGECNVDNSPPQGKRVASASEHEFGQSYNDMVECVRCGLEVIVGEPYPSECSGISDA